MREDKLKYLLEIYRENERKIKELEQIKSHISQLEVAVLRINNLKVREDIDSLLKSYNY
ncbi:hypothetical protein BvCmsHHP056_04010 [Escherichia coli]|uniref:Uncharacterized protein n=2 Tax=Escherichia coli TaxID=562 RepID=A0A478G7U7_ECOLX|nr:hypothetical protein ERJG_04784 [Escherichia coli M863]EIG83053.1 hypothetical protein EC12741_B0040 [Escherichia coli 1.2741]BDI39393.1 hypothetical protein EsCdI10290_05621 [Escherichia sp. 10290]BDI44397.1 hypothetical protein EsCd1HHP024_05624 [Escherichia sp. HH091_1A]BDI49213.1 hypothetical protein EsCd1HHP049_05467 [Escherichia sp. HH154_1D]BDI54031.1 hypothetical protein EsCd1KSP079_05486 [Escherichia sp. KS167_9B]GCG01152.1 hypothetical protein BvCms12BK_01976 [Escherichia coli]